MLREAKIAGLAARVGNFDNMATTKTIGVRILLPEDLHTALKQAAEKDERKLAVYIVRLLRQYSQVGAGLVATRYPVLSAKDALAQGQIHPDWKDAKFDSSDLTSEQRQTGTTEEVGARPPETPLHEWPNERLVEELKAKRASAQVEKAAIAALPAGPDAEKRKAALEQALQFIGVLERESLKRRGPVIRKPPQPPSR
jgi:hypothetical protein